MSSELLSKYESLKHLIKSYGKVGVAISGGVDSTLLLYAACDVLAYNKVIGLHCRSVLNSGESTIEELYESCFAKRARLHVIEHDPLSFPEFINNDSQRCYYCKKKTYHAFLDYLKSLDCSILLDGTNLDDLRESRPGFAALDELSVKTPLVGAGMGKKEIRFLARLFDLPNSVMPSNSCLATRLVFAPKITASGLKKVEEIEMSLKRIGFEGCRARPQKESVLLEIQQQHFLEISRKHKRFEVIDLCKKHGFATVYLDIQGR